MDERRILGSAVVLASMIACHHGPSASSTTTTTAGRVVGGNEANTRLTRARCEREVACDNVGKGKAFADRGACTHELARSSEADPLALSCPRGIRESQLEVCLAEVRHEDCGNPRHTAERLDPCKTDELCPTH